MQGIRLLLPILAALAVGACARQQAAYYVVDPNTGQPVPVVQQQQLAAPQYAQQTYQQPQAEPSERGLFSSRQSVPQVYAQQSYVPQPQYTQPAPQAQYAQDQRGLFSLSPAYAQQSYAEPAYQQPIAPPQAAASSGRGLFNSPGIGGPYIAAADVMGRGF